MNGVVLTEHAIARYQERVRPALPITAVRRELRELVYGGTLVAELDWHDAYDGSYDAYLSICDGVALALRMTEGKWAAVTTLTRGEDSPKRVKARRAWKAQKRRARRGRRFGSSSRGRQGWDTKGEYRDRRGDGAE